MSMKTVFCSFSSKLNPYFRKTCEIAVTAIMITLPYKACMQIRHDDNRKSHVESSEMAADTKEGNCCNNDRFKL